MVTPFWHLRRLLPEQSSREPQLNQIIGADSPAIVHLVPLLISQKNADIAGKSATIRAHPDRALDKLWNGSCAMKMHWRVTRSALLKT